MADVQISLGQRWTQELAALHARADIRPVGHVIPLGALTDTIDLVVGSENLTESITRERLFPFISDLLRALARTRQLATRKCFIECGEEPWEFALYGVEPATVLLSLYSTDRSREIICHDLSISREELERAALGAGERLLETITQIARPLLNVDAARDLHASLEALRVARTLSVSSLLHEHAPSSQPGVARVGSVKQSGLGFTFRYSPCASAAMVSPAEHGLDLHALFLRGELTLVTEDRAALVCRPYPFLVLEAMLEQLEGLSGTQVGATEFHSTHLLLEREEGRGFQATSPGDGAQLSLSRLTLEEVVQAACALVDCMGEDLIQAIPAIAENRRFAAIMARGERLSRWLEQRASVGFEERPVSAEVCAMAHPRAVLEGASRHAPARARFPWQISNVLAMHPHLRWALSLEEMRLRRISMGDDVLCVGTSQGVMALDLGSGEERWRFTRGSVRLGALERVGEDAILHQAQHDVFVILGEARGEVRARFVMPRPHRVSCMLWYGDDVLLLLDERGAVTAISPRGGEVLWHRSGRARGAALYASGEDNLVVLQAGVLERIDPVTGATIWEVEAGHYARHVCVHQGRAVVIGAGANRAQTNARAFSLEDGVRHQELALDGYFLGPARSFGEELLLCVERGRRPVIEALHGESLMPAWARPLREQMRTLSPAWREVEVDGEPHLLIQTAASQTTLVKLSDGTQRWSFDAAPLTRTPPEPSLINDGFLTLSDALELRRLGGGELVYRFDGFLDEPCVMSARGALDVLLGEQPLDDGPPTLLCLSFSHYLAIV